jgi:anti-sigma factor RsiW
MNCARYTQVLDAYLDDELDRATGAEIARHLAGCAACRERRDERAALSRSIRACAPYFSAPDGLRHRVFERSAEDASPFKRTRSRPSWLQASALILAVALASATAGYWLGRPPIVNALHEHVIASHIASLGATRPLTDVTSDDRHTVKPWFQGRVDFAPPVRDLSAQGFILIGARLDHIADRPAAAIVYRVRRHLVNLFVWRADASGHEPVAVSNVRGFSVATWSQGGLRFSAVSDIDSRELERFAQLFGSL